MLISLLGYFSLMVTTLTAVVALLINFSNHNFAFEKADLPGPTIVQTVMADETPPWRSPDAKEASPAKNISPIASTAKVDAKESSQHKPKALARQQNNYEGRGYGNAQGYAQETQYGPQRLFSNW
jgi:hypothetical protein